MERPKNVNSCGNCGTVTPSLAGVVSPSQDFVSERRWTFGCSKSRKLKWVNVGMG